MFCSGKAGGGYLSMHIGASAFPLNSGPAVPLPNLGFSLEGFTRSTRSVSGTASSLWHFYRFSAMAQALGKEHSRCALRRTRAY